MYYLFVNGGRNVKINNVSLIDTDMGTS